jgi:hypothetical protein
VKQVVYTKNPGSRWRSAVECHVCRRVCRAQECLLRINDESMIHRSCMEEFLDTHPFEGELALKTMNDLEIDKTFKSLRSKILRQVRSGKMQV